jgi:hypothetical protein
MVKETKDIFKNILTTNLNMQGGKLGIWSKTLLPLSKYSSPITHCRKFATKTKRAGESNKGNFGNLKKKSPYFEEKKKLEVARCRQCVTIGRQN